MDHLHIFVLTITLTGLVASSPLEFVPSTEMNPFVVGGVDVTIENYPFVVVCYYYGSFSCGGSILNENWVLTAAHCSCNKIQYGVTQRNDYGPNMVEVVQSVRYPGWTSYQNDDIQLLRLAEPIVFGKNAQPVKLPKPQWEVKGDSFETPSAVLGWGYDTWGTLPLTLQRGDYFVINNTDCEKIHQGIAPVYDFNCCNGVKGGGVADCNGDSGGPIVTWIDGQLVEYGVVSWSVKPCTNPTFPAVGTKTSHYVNWISQITGIPLEQFCLYLKN